MSLIPNKKYVLVIVDDYSRYTWTHFLRSKDETPNVLIDFLRLAQRGLHAQVRTVRIDKGIEFLNITLHVYFAQEGIKYQTSTALTPEQNGVVKKWNRTLVEAARTMLSAAKVPLFFWAEAIATTCFTQNRSLVIPRHEKTPYHIINVQKLSIKFFHIFGSLCYIVRDGENLDKMKGKGDACIFVGHSNQSRAYRVYNKRTRVIVETIHVNFDELPLMTSDHNKVPAANMIVMTLMIELESLFGPLLDEYFNGGNQVVSKSFTVTTADAFDKCKQQPDSTSSTSTLSTTITADGNFDLYGYIKNHKKTVKNGQSRTQETEEYKRAKDLKPKSTSVNYGSTEHKWLLNRGIASLAIHVPNFDLTAINDDQIERKNGGLGLECWREPQEPGSFTSAL
ncbi:retrovirus-related pol polyprotein from transposon TNT 1-94 [Tanacetum coccineum]